MTYCNTKLAKAPSRLIESVNELETDFYARLFALNPNLIPIFGDAQRPGAKLNSALAHMIHGLDRMESVLDDICFLALRQVQHGVSPAHYAVVRQALLETFEMRLERFCDLNARSSQPDNCYVFAPVGAGKNS